MTHPQPSTLAQIRARLKKATPGPWLYGDWTIFDSDRPAQERKEPYWTFTDGPYSYGSISTGPFGRKAMEPERIISGDGYETSDVSISKDDAIFLANVHADITYLLQREAIWREKLESAVAALEYYSTYGKDLRNYNGIELMAQNVLPDLKQFLSDGGE
jgi:hypothetical protein